MARIGDPCTRPDEDSFLLPTSFDLEQEVKEWEGTALVVKAMSAPASTGPRQIEAVVLDELRLRKGDITVSRHQPEPFLIKFNRKEHAKQAASMSCLKHHNIVINVRPWRSLSVALGVALFFRVRLCLEGVPIHAWNMDLIERMVGRTCSLECIDTNLLHPDDTRTIDLWAWTANPSQIPKRLWLLFTSGARNPSVSISTTPPDRWQSGIKYRVLMHLEWIYDYTGTTVDSHGVLGTGVQFAVPEPDRRRLVWHRGAVDGERPPATAYPPFNVPPPYHDRRMDRTPAMESPSRSLGGHTDAPCPDNNRDGRRNTPHSEERCSSDRDRRGKARYNNDHPKFGHTFHHPDDDADYRRHGHRSGRLSGARSVFDEPVFRERERSPRRRGKGTSYGRRHHDLEPMMEPNNMTDTLAPGKTAAAEDTPSAELPGTEAWFRVKDAVPWGVPLATITTRLRCDLRIDELQHPGDTTIQMVEEALRRIELQATTTDVSFDESQGCASPTVQASIPTVLQLAVPHGGGSPTVPVQPPAPTEEPRGVHAFFTKAPTPALPLSTPVARPPRQRRVYDMSNVRRSARLAKKPALQAGAKAQINLCRKLRLPGVDLNPIEQVIADFIAMYNGPLPEYVLAGLSTMFGLDDAVIDDMDDALLQLVGQEVDDLQAEALQNDEV
ncbi:unnamed protein product [Urochloa humidicola]